MTILQVWDTNYDTVDKETVNCLIPHIVHLILVYFVFCEQFMDNLFLALHTSQQEAVTATLKEIRHDTAIRQHVQQKVRLQKCTSAPMSGTVCPWYSACVND